MLMTLTILGNNSALPAHGRNPTSQVLQVDNFSCLIDCGEGTQWQLRKYKIKTGKIKYIFISHLHGDHYFGLIGLLTSFSLNGRPDDLHIFGPPMLEKILQLQVEVSGGPLCYKIYFHALTEEKEVMNTEQITVECFKMKHRIECWGFIFREKKLPRTIDPDKVKNYEVPVEFFKQLQQGEDFVTAGGTIISNEELTNSSSDPKSYAFCGDTVYFEDIIAKIRKVDILYHETTFLNELKNKASERFHSTTIEAGTIALKAGVGKLIIGHFSSRYEDLEPFRQECRTIFPETELAREGVCFKI